MKFIVVTAILLMFGGVFLSMGAYHNIDLAWNADVSSSCMNMGISGDLMTIGKMYMYGLKMIVMSIFSFVIAFIMVVHQI